VPDLAAPIRRSPLKDRAPIGDAAGAISMRELPFLRKYVLRADPHEAVERLRSALSLGLPFDPLTSSSSGDLAFLWMGPDEWLLVTGPDDPVAFRRAAEALAGTHHQLVDVSDYHTVIELEGPKSRELLMKLTTLDVHPRAFQAGMVSGMILGRANATLWQVRDDHAGNGPAFRIFVRWSMADYLWCLLADAGREWGMPAQAAVGGEKLTIA
jgi:sarcosine oxidase subunit gamma